MARILLQARIIKVCHRRTVSDAIQKQKNGFNPRLAESTVEMQPRIAMGGEKETC